MKKHSGMEEVIKAWQLASKDLEILFISKFKLESPEGQSYSVAGYLPEFGGPKGTIILSINQYVNKDEDRIYELIENQGYYSSFLNPEVYSSYDRLNFMATLNDWGWFGDSKKIPKWFSGGMRRHGG